jgi:hypothetical protein
VKKLVEIVLTLEWDKETKRTIRFKERGTNEMSHTLYLSKDEVRQLGEPTIIEVTIRNGEHGSGEVTTTDGAPGLDSPSASGNA